VRLTNSPLSCAEYHEIWEPKPPGTLWATLGLLRDSFTLQYNKYINKYFYKYLCTGNEISSRFIVRRLYGFSLIRNNAWSDDGLKKGRK